MEHFICEGEQTNRTDFYESSLIFGYGNTDEADIEEGVMKLHTILLPQIDKK
jgi:DNA-binding transcriptional MocR family regulator